MSRIVSRIARAIAGALVAMPVAMSASAADTAATPITVFVAKKFITMDPGWPQATAVAVQDGKILSVGRDLQDLEPWLAGKTYQLDKSLADKVVLPGFVEAHGHPLLGGIELNLPLVSAIPTAQPYGPDFPGVKDAEDALKLIKQYVAEAKDPNETVLVWGWDVVAMGGRHLDKQVLDSISSTQPIIVWDASGHFIYANSALLKKQQITDAALKVNGVQAGPDGKLNGQFLGVTAGLMVMQKVLAPYLKLESSIPRMRSMLDLSLKGGITTQSELVMGTFNLELEQVLLDKVFNDPQTRTRLVTVSDGATVTAAKKAKAVEFVKSLEAKSTDTLMFKGVKFFSDDSFIGLGMMVDQPGYTDGRKGVYIQQPGEEIVRNMLPWWKAGMQVHIHSNGNAGNQSTLDALAAMQAQYPRFDHRFTVEHFGLTTPEMARRLKALGGVASINPYYVHYRGEYNAPMLGTDRAHTAARLKTLLDAGNVVSLHSDTPMGPPRPLEWAWIAVNRVGQSGKVLAPDERVTVEQALKMITIDAAYTLGEEERIGSIQAGKFADFTVLEADPYSVEPMALKDIKVWGTVLGGRVQPVSDIQQQPGLEVRQYATAKPGLELSNEQRAALAALVPLDAQALAKLKAEAETCNNHGTLGMMRMAQVSPSFVTGNGVSR